MKGQFRRALSHQGGVAEPRLGGWKRQSTARSCGEIRDMSVVTAGRGTPGWSAGHGAPVHRIGTHRELSSTNVNRTEVRAVMECGTPGHGTEIFEHE